MKRMKISTHLGCDTNAPTVVKYTPECTYGYLGNEIFPGEDPRTPLPIRRKVKIGPATPLVFGYGISHKLQTFILYLCVWFMIILDRKRHCSCTKIYHSYFKNFTLSDY